MVESRFIHTSSPGCFPPVPPPLEVKLRKIAADAAATLEKKIEEIVRDAAMAAADAREAAEEAREAAEHMHPAPDSVGSEEIKDGSILVEDLSEEVKNKMRHTYVEEEEKMYLGGFPPF